MEKWPLFHRIMAKPPYYGPHCDTVWNSDKLIIMSDVNPEWRLVPIGRGSFASVSILSGRPVAFKHVIVRERSGELKTEFEVLRALYDICDTDSFFGVPRPLAFYDPHNSTSYFSACSPPLKSRRQPLVNESVCQRKWFQIAGIRYCRVRNGSGLTTSIINCKNNTHVVLSAEHVQGIGSHTLPTLFW